MHSFIGVLARAFANSAVVVAEACGGVSSILLGAPCKNTDLDFNRVRSECFAAWLFVY